MSDQLIAGLMSMRERLKLFGDQMDGDITHIDETIAHIRTLKKQVALLTPPQSSAPVVGDDLESKYNVLRNLLQRSWREVHIGTKKYQLTLTVTPEYLERIESALTGRG